MPTLPNAHALIIGIANYQRGNSLSPVVLNDARAIAETLGDPALCAYPTANVLVLTDQQATRSAIRQALTDLAAKSDKESTVFIYLSSHCWLIEDGYSAGEYLLPVDADFSSAERLAQSSISGIEFTAALQAISARKVVVVLDCCHAGGFGQLKDAVAPAFKAGFSESYYDRLKSGVGRVILAASRSNESSWILPGDANSLFTKHLLAGLRGNSISEDGLIRIFDLFEYLQPRVTGEQPNQHPIFKAEIEENFPIALYLGGLKSTNSANTQQFRYDAYISYVDKGIDSDWVWNVLVAKLEEAGLTVAVSGDVEAPGVARVVNIERGIRQAKRTIVILSEAYLADNVAEFENTLAQTMGIQEGSYRLLPVKIAEIDENRLPTRLSMLTSLNFTHQSKQTPQV